MTKKILLLVFGGLFVITTLYTISTLLRNNSLKNSSASPQLIPGQREEYNKIQPYE